MIKLAVAIVTFFAAGEALLAQTKSPVVITRFFTFSKPPNIQLPEISFEACENCAVLYGFKRLHMDGTIDVQAPLFKEDGKLTMGSGYWTDGIIQSFIVPYSSDETVVQTCIFDLHICSDKSRPESCEPIDPGMFYEFNEKTGAARTSIPLKQGLTPPPSSEDFQKDLCRNQVS